MIVACLVVILQYWIMKRTMPIYAKKIYDSILKCGFYMCIVRKNNHEIIDYTE